MTLKCEKCGKKFATETNLNKHLVTHREREEEPSERKRPRKKKSATCKEFCKKSDLQSHVNEHRINCQENDLPRMKEKREPTDLIVSTCMSNQEAVHQVKNSSVKRGRPSKYSKRIASACQDCKQVFYRKCDLHLHRKMEHSEYKYTCSVCKRSFPHEKCLKMHYRFHSDGGTYKCVYCDKIFNKGWKMKIHMVNHNGKSPYSCRLCGEEFLYPGKLTDHLKIEHDLYYACKDCGVPFVSFEEQKDHVCFIYSCKDCDKSFNIRDDLVSHIETHKVDSITVKQDISLAASTCLLPSLMDLVSGLAKGAGTLLPGTSCGGVSKMSGSGFCSESMQSSDDVANKDVKDFALKQVTNCESLFSHSSKRQYQNFPTIPKTVGNFEDKTPGNSVLIKSENDDSFIPCNNTDVKLEGDETTVPDLSSKPNTLTNEMDRRVNSLTDSVPGLTSARHFLSVMEKQPCYSDVEDMKDGNADSFFESCSVDKPKPSSLKTWLTGDNSPRVTKDFVFDRGLNGSNNSETAVKSEVKLEDGYSLSFEALC